MERQLMLSRVRSCARISAAKHSNQGRLGWTYGCRRIALVDFAKDELFQCFVSSSWNCVDPIVVEHRFEVGPLEPHDGVSAASELVEGDAALTHVRI
jgi:hypothetical protein